MTVTSNSFRAFDRKDLGESLGPICVPLVFLAVLLLRPTGLFGARA